MLLEVEHEDFEPAERTRVGRDPATRRDARSFCTFFVLQHDKLQAPPRQGPGAPRARRPPPRTTDFFAPRPRAEPSLPLHAERQQSRAPGFRVWGGVGYGRAGGTVVNPYPPSFTHVDPRPPDPYPPTSRSVKRSEFKVLKRLACAMFPSARVGPSAPSRVGPSRGEAGVESAGAACGLRSRPLPRTESFYGLPAVGHSTFAPNGEFYGLPAVGTRSTS